MHSPILGDVNLSCMGRFSSSAYNGGKGATPITGCTSVLASRPIHGETAATPRVGNGWAFSTEEVVVLNDAVTLPARGWMPWENAPARLMQYSIYIEKSVEPQFPVSSSLAATVDTCLINNTKALDKWRQYFVILGSSKGRIQERGAICGDDVSAYLVQDGTGSELELLLCMHDK